MKRPQVVFPLALTTLLGGCESQPAPAAPVASPPSAAAPSSSAPAATGFKRYGDAITLTDPQPLARVLASPDSFKDKSVLIEGKVRKACSRKGCWMEIADSIDNETARCRVTFKDYGFFVPTDSSGADARVQAVVAVEQVKPEYVEHLESEGAKFAHKNADGSADEVRLVATAVELKK
jgi:hypothetical protein